MEHLLLYKKIYKKLFISFGLGSSKTYEKPQIEQEIISKLLKRSLLANTNSGIY
jgi:hypothetical protein